MNLNKDQEAIKQAILYGPVKIVVVDAPGGTGKTVICNDVRESMPNVIVVCPTGVSALLANGSTHFRVFGTPVKHPANPNIIPNYFNRKTKIACTNAKYFHKSKSEVLEVAGLLILDEAFMIRCDHLDFIDMQMRISRKNPKEPFGGIRVAAFGDLGQIPPVVTAKDKRILESYGYKSPFGILESRILNT